MLLQQSIEHVSIVYTCNTYLHEDHPNANIGANEHD